MNQAGQGTSPLIPPPSGDFGVDFERNIGNNQFPVQVKCKKNDISFDPVATLHSKMVKQNAKGGYVITTSSFTEAAKQYAEGLYIKLVDAVRLVDLWLDGVKKDEKDITPLFIAHRN